MATTKVTSGGITDATIATADIADQAVTLDKLPHGTSSNDGKFLRANNGGDPSFETVSIPAGTTINNEGDDRIITSTATSNTLNGEANLTFNGQKILLVNTQGSSPSDRGLQVEASANLSDGNFLPAINLNPNASNTHRTRAAICGVSHNGTSGMHLAFLTRHAADGTQLSTSDEKMRIDTSGKILIGATTSHAGKLVVKDTDNSGNQVWIVGRANNDTASVSFRNNADDAYRGRIQVDNSNGMQFQVQGSERMRVDNSGNVGIGTTNPSGESINGSQNLVIMDTTSDGGMNIKTGTSANAQIHFSDTSGNGQGRLVYDHSNDRMKLFTSGTEKFSLESDGRAAINTVADFSNRCTSPSSSGDDLVISADGNTGITLHSNSTGATNAIWFGDSDDPDVGSVRYLHGNNQIRLHLNANSTPVMQFNSDLTIIFQNTIYSNGAAYSTGSDLRMKSNLVKFTNTLDNLKKITGYKFDITNQSTGHTRKSAGVIAQDVEKVYPDFIDTNPETGMKSLEYNALIGVLVEAVKDLTSKVETLETKVAALA